MMFEERRYTYAELRPERGVSVVDLAPEPRIDWADWVKEIQESLKEEQRRADALGGVLDHLENLDDDEIEELGAKALWESIPECHTVPEVNEAIYSLADLEAEIRAAS